MTNKCSNLILIFQFSASFFDVLKSTDDGFDKNEPRIVESKHFILFLFTEYYKFLHDLQRDNVLVARTDLDLTETVLEVSTIP